MRFNKFALAGLAVCGSVLLAGCGGGGGGDDSSPVAQEDLTVKIDPTTGRNTMASILGQNFEFANGIPALGTTGNTSLKFTGNAAKPDFAITSGANSASGSVTYGSCIFTTSQSTFAAGHPLAVGQVSIVSDCWLKAFVVGRLADAITFDADVAFGLNGVFSKLIKMPTYIRPNGMVFVNGVGIGSVPVVTPTGATGSGS